MMAKMLVYKKIHSAIGISKVLFFIDEIFVIFLLILCILCYWPLKFLASQSPYDLFLELFDSHLIPGYLNAYNTLEFFFFS